MRRRRPWWLMTTTCFSGLERIKWRTHLARATFLSSVASNTPSLRFHSTLRSTSDQSSHGCGNSSLVSASGAPVSQGKAPHSCSCGRMTTGIGLWLVDEGRSAEKPRSIVWRVRRNGETRMTVSAGLSEAKKLGYVVGIAMHCVTPRCRGNRASARERKDKEGCEEKDARS